MRRVFTPGTLAQLACVLEATARKPGNVHRFLDFDDALYLDFLISAVAIGRVMDDARSLGLGATCLEAVEATQELVSSNTNLGLILLLAPLAAVSPDSPLQEGVAAVIRASTIEDARLVYQAIRVARPGGLGVADDQDVADEPTVTLLEAMQLAADRDAVARQFASGYADVFDTALPALSSALARGRPLETAVIAAHLRLMAELPDTLIARKRGAAESVEASKRAASVLEGGWPDREPGLSRCVELDQWLRAVGHARNPGTTADLVAAALFAALRDGTITLPAIRGRTWWSSPVV
jgi:triphosphoribosyl-dephospho-CoA synthase